MMKHVWLAVACLCLCPGAWSSAHAQAPAIKSFSPTSGPVGTTVVIEGNNFVGVNFVTFGGTVYAGGEYNSEKITVSVPPGAKSGPITVFATYGTVSTNQDFVVTGGPPSDAPVIISPATARGTQDQPFTYQIRADRPVSTYTADDTPPGLNFDSATGLLSGTPVGYYGTYQMQVGATDAEGNSGTANLTIEIATDEPTVILSATPRRIVQGTGQQGVFTFSLSRPATQLLGFNYHVMGNAVGGTDYGALSGYAQIQPGETSVDVTVVPDAPLGSLAAGVRKVKLVLDGRHDGSILSGTDAARIRIVFP